MTRRGWVLFAMLSVIWGIPYLLIKVAVGSVSVPMVVFARTAIAAAVLLPPALRGGQMGEVRRHWRPVTAFAVLEIIGPWCLLSDAERRLSSSTSGLLIAAVPILAVVLARLTGGAERLGVRRWTGLLVGFGGVAVLAAPHLRGGDAWSLCEVLLTAFGYAFAPLIAARHLADVPSLPMTAACLTGAALVYAPAAAWTWPTSVPRASVLGSLTGLALVCTALAFMVFFALIREIGTSRAMVITYVNPAVAITAGVALLGEPLTPLILLSFAMILAGCAMATTGKRQAEPGEEPVPDLTGATRQA